MLRNNKKRNSTQKGSAMITATVFFMFISLTIILGMAGPVVRQIRMVNDLIQSKESYFLAEAGMEDAIQRISYGMNIDDSGQETVIDGNTAVTVITDVANGRELVANADWNNRVRNLKTELRLGEGLAFNYGIQAGQGGFEIRNATVIGNIYAGGDVIGTHSGATVTGSVFASNKAEEIPNQSNGFGSGGDQHKLQFGSSDTYQDAAQSFVLDTITQPTRLHSVEVQLEKVGTPSNLNLRIVEDDGGKPGDVVLGSTGLSASHVIDTYEWAAASFPEEVWLEAGVSYWIVIDSSTDTNNFYKWVANDGYGGGSAMLGRFGTGSWQATSPAGLGAHFKVYLEGEKSRIEQITAGYGEDGTSTDDAHAHEVTNSTIAGNLYCQVESTNNKSCDTSLPDPSPQVYPISDGEIVKWKADAEEGSLIDGNYAPTTDASEIGPVKITGDLILDNNHELTIQGTIWVEGNVVVHNGSTVSLDESYRRNSGVMIVDGYIDLRPGASFSGSGYEDSFIMLLTTSECPDVGDCDGNYAVSVANTADSIILNAQQGTIFFAQNAGAQEATGHKIIMANNAEVVYNSGLANVHFTSGPAGGFNVISWKEVE